jgi:hypothetical protein
MSSLSGQELIARFPRIFKGREPKLGISTKVGWNLLLIQLFEKIDRLLGDSDATLFRVEQVKEKFGGLRVYYSIGDSTEMVLDLISEKGVMSIRKHPSSESGFPREAVDGCIAEAAALARVTCERCGDPGTLRQGGWLRVLCDQCSAALLSKRDRSGRQ